MEDPATGNKIIYNGEVFNWPEIREELAGLGHVFESGTDTEVLLKAYEEWGASCVERFNGFWAFLIVSTERSKHGESVYISRDRSGIKPLYYYKQDDVFVVSSEVKPIFSYCGKDIVVDTETLSNYLVYGRSHYNKNTIYKDIYELEPARSAYLDFRSLELKIHRYWDPSTETIERDDEEALEEFSALLEDATRIRLRSDRELAITLSGGVDSTAIAIAARKVHGGQLRAFTSHFPHSKEIDEVELAKQTTAKLDIEHELVEVQASDVKENYERLAKYQELFVLGFSQLVNWFVLSKIKESGIVVFLNGQGGDELFLGYTKFLPSYVARDFNPLAFYKRLVEVAQLTSRSKSTVFAETIYFTNERVRNAVAKHRARKTYHDAFVRKANLSQVPMSRSYRNLQTGELFDGHLCRLLRFDDRSASAFGLEGRPVFMDHRLVEFALTLAPEQMIRAGRTKHIVRRYIAKHGLENLAWSTKKLGFPAPKKQWLKQVQDSGLLSKMPGQIAILNSKATDLASVHAKQAFKVHNAFTTFREMQKVCGNAPLALA